MDFSDDSEDDDDDSEEDESEEETPKKVLLHFACLIFVLNLFHTFGLKPFGLTCIVFCLTECFMMKSAQNKRPAPPAKAGFAKKAKQATPDKSGSIFFFHPSVL